MESTLEVLEEVEDDLMARSFLYDDPGVYREAVEAALVAVRAAIAEVEQQRRRHVAV